MNRKSSFLSVLSLKIHVRCDCFMTFYKCASLSKIKICYMVTPLLCRALWHPLSHLLITATLWGRQGRNYHPIITPFHRQEERGEWLAGILSVSCKGQQFSALTLSSCSCATGFKLGFMLKSNKKVCWTMLQHFQTHRGQAGNVDEAEDNGKDNGEQCQQLLGLFY